jgi:outer membrane protein assembly factor BamB
MLLGAALVAGIVVVSVRKVIFTGDLVPIVELRWWQTRDTLLEENRRQQAQTGPPAAVELSTEASADFPEYRGRGRTGIVSGPPLTHDWKGHPPPCLWRQPVGGGYAAFAVAGNAAVTIEQRRNREAVVCYDTATGKERWTHAYPARFTETLGGEGPRATPTIADGQVYALGATGMLTCLELKSGTVRWSVNILSDNDNVPWGMSGSPLVYDQVVVVNPGVQRPSAKGRALVAYDR